MRTGDGHKLHHGNLHLDIWNYSFTTRVVKHWNWNTNKTDLTELHALHAPVLSGRSSHTTSRAPFQSKLFYDPLTLRVTYIEAMAAKLFIYFLASM